MPIADVKIVSCERSNEDTNAKSVPIERTEWRQLLDRFRHFSLVARPRRFKNSVRVFFSLSSSRIFLQTLEKKNFFFNEFLGRFLSSKLRIFFIEDFVVLVPAVHVCVHIARRRPRPVRPLGEKGNAKRSDWLGPTLLSCIHYFITSSFITSFQTVFRDYFDNRCTEIDNM